MSRVQPSLISALFLLFFLIFHATSALAASLSQVVTCSTAEYAGLSEEVAISEYSDRASDQVCAGKVTTADGSTYKAEFKTNSVGYTKLEVATVFKTSCQLLKEAYSHGIQTQITGPFVDCTESTTGLVFPKLKIQDISVGDESRSDYAFQDKAVGDKVLIQAKVNRYAVQPYPYSGVYCDVQFESDEGFFYAIVYPSKKDTSKMDPKTVANKQANMCGTFLDAYFDESILNLSGSIGGDAGNERALNEIKIVKTP
jgi:hypothetical protein